jgi:hypothetical protein
VIVFVTSFTLQSIRSPSSIDFFLFEKKKFLASRKTYSQNSVFILFHFIIKIVVYLSFSSAIIDGFILIRLLQLLLGFLPFLTKAGLELCCILDI